MAKYLLTLEDNKDTSQPKSTVRFKTIQDLASHMRMIITEDVLELLMDSVEGAIDATNEGKDPAESLPSDFDNIKAVVDGIEKAATVYDLQQVAEDWNRLVNDNYFDTLMEVFEM